jgi:hypothetical protein
MWSLLALLLVVRATSRREGRGVILDHLEFGRRLLHGEELYGPWTTDPASAPRPLHTPYPPSFAVLTAPFAAIEDLLGLRAARGAWSLLQIASLFAIAVLMRRLATASAPNEPARNWHWLWLATALVSARFVLRDTHGGGGNLINLALCLAAHAAAEQNRMRLAGVLLGCSLSTKPTQVWLLPLFLVLGRKRAVGWAALTGAAFVFGSLAMQRFDPTDWSRWLVNTWQFSTATDAYAAPPGGFPPFEWMNQSLRCALARWFGSVPDEYSARVVLGVTPGLGWPASTLAWLLRGGSAIALLYLGFVAHRRRHDARARLWVLAATFVLSVLLSPLSWKAHHTALIPALSLLLLRLPERPTLVLLAAWVLCCQPGADLVGDAADEWLNSTYIVTAWDIALFVVAVRAAASTPHEHGDAALRTTRTERLG